MIFENILRENREFGGGNLNARLKEADKLVKDAVDGFHARRQLKRLISRLRLERSRAARALRIQNQEPYQNRRRGSK